MESNKKENIIPEEPKKKSLKVKIFIGVTILILVLIIDFVILLGLNKFGVININSSIEKIPGLSIFLNENDTEDPDKTKIEELSLEIESLKQELSIEKGNSIKTKTELESIIKENKVLDEKILKLEDKKEKDSDLSKYYSQMKPKAAAGIFNNMDANLAVEIIKEMNETSVSSILQYMDPTKANEITKIYKELYN